MPLIALILLGYFLKQKNFFSAEFLKFGNKLVFKVCLPVLLFKNITDIDSLADIPWTSVIYSLGVIFLLILVGFITTKFIPDPKQKGVINQCIFRSNFALIGVPLAELMAGSEGVTVAALLSLFSIPIYNVVAVIVLTVFKESGKGKIDYKNILVGIVKNPLIIGVLSGLLVLMLKTVLPVNPVSDAISSLSFIETTLAYIARSATPLALIVLGGQFDFKRVKGYKFKLVLGTVGRLVLAPIIGLVPAIILTKCGVLYFSPAVMSAFIALFGTPVAVSSAIMAEALDNDGQLAAQLVVWTSLFSVITLFITIFLVKLIGML